MAEMKLQLVASMLRRGRSLDWLSSGLTLIAMLIGLAPLTGLPAHPFSAACCALLVATGVLGKYWALRVALDAELFQHLADAPEQLQDRAAALDQALVQLGLQPAGQQGRAWDERCRGALRLLRAQALTLTFQLLGTLATIISLPCLPITG
ncbi:hypothetical protein ACX0MV_00935 [Pseudomonas borbori]